MAILKWTLAVVALAALSACQAPQGRNVDDAQVRAAVTQALDEHGQAAEQLDVTAAASMFTEDARIMLPTLPDVLGRDSIAAFMTRAWATVRPRRVRFITEEVHVFGDMAVSVGTYDFMLEPQDQPPVEDQGRFMLLWTHQGDGSWRVYRDITNSSVTPQPR